MLNRWIVAPDMPPQSGRVDWVSGASFMVRRQVFESVGMFDEDFFLYFEETDLCRRALSAGFETHYVRQARVQHIGSVSTGIAGGSARCLSRRFRCGLNAVPAGIRWPRITFSFRPMR